ncbi:efflux RND transporter periplasmic adaptor subunit [Ravibacter arvi]
MHRIITVAIAGLLVASCGPKKHAENLAKEQAGKNDEFRYSAVTIKGAQPVREINLPGELESFYETDLFPRVSSYISKIHVDIGDRVNKGQLLAELEAPELIANLTAAFSKVKAAEAMYQSSRATYQRALKTRKTPGAISEMDVETFWSKAMSDSLMVVAEQAHYESVKQLVDYLKITAPFAGVVTDRRLSPGAFVGPGGQNSVPLLKIKQLDRLRLRLAVPEAYLGDIRSGAHVQFSVRTFQNQVFSGNISRISHSVRPDTRSEMIEIDISNPDRKLKPGMFVSARLPVQSGEGSIFVPKTSVLSNMEQTFVIRVVNGVAERVSVERGDVTDSQVQIFGELKPGDVILKVASDEIPNKSAIAIETVN